MKLSYEGIGQWAATFACSEVSEGEVVKISANDTVASCSADEAFCGMVLSVSRIGDACTVALGGMVTAGYSGSDPTLGRCILCGDTGYCRGSVCACLQNYYAREQIRQLSSMLDVSTQSFDTFELDWYDTEPGAFSRSPRETMERNFTVCRRFAQDFGHSGGNLLLFGDPGLGKTFLSASIARVVSEDGFSVVYDTAGHVFARCEAAKFRSDEEPDAAEDVRRYEKSDLLILDDLGTEMTTAFVQSVLYQLVNSRLLAGKSTVINTNLTPPELGVRYGAAVRSRLEGEYTVLPFIGRDIRKLKRERS